MHYFSSGPLCGMGLSILARRRRPEIDRLFSHEIPEKILGQRYWTEMDRNPGRLMLWARQSCFGGRTSPHLCLDPRDRWLWKQPEAALWAQTMATL